MLKHHSVCTIFLSLFLVFVVTDFHIARAMRIPPSEAESYTYRNKRSPRVFSRSKDFETSDVVWLNPGVLSNLEAFFENLSSKMTGIGAGEKSDEVEINVRDSQLKNTLVDHQLQGYKPSYKIRNYVQSPEPVSLKGTNRHDPSYKWTGLGKRKRHRV